MMLTALICGGSSIMPGPSTAFRPSLPKPVRSFCRLLDARSMGRRRERTKTVNPTAVEWGNCTRHSTLVSLLSTSF